MSVFAAETHPTSCTAVGGPFLGAVASRTLSFTIRAKDNYGNGGNTGGDLFHAVVEGMGAEFISSPVTDNEDGSHTVDFAVLRAGSYTAAVKLDGRHISGSPFKLAVIACDIYGPACTVACLGLEECQAGQIATYSVVAKDEFSNVLEHGADLVNLSATFESAVSVGAHIQYVGTGLYQITAAMAVAGKYQLQVCLSGQLIGDRPWHMTCLPGPAHGVYSSVSQRHICGAGTTSSFTVLARDQHNNDLTRGGDAVMVTVVGVTTVGSSVEDLNDGQ
jgi:hypothetical protein